MLFDQFRVLIREHPARPGGLNVEIEVWTSARDPFLEATNEFWMGTPDENARRCAAWVNRYLLYLLGVIKSVDVVESDAGE